MSIGVWYWIILVLSIVFTGYLNRADWPGWARGNLVLFILFVLLGLRVFGSPIQ